VDIYRALTGFQGDENLRIGDDVIAKQSPMSRGQLPYPIDAFAVGCNVSQFIKIFKKNGSNFCGNFAFYTLYRRLLDSEDLGIGERREYESCFEELMEARNFVFHHSSSFDLLIPPLSYITLDGVRFQPIF